MFKLADLLHGTAAYVERIHLGPEAEHVLLKVGLLENAVECRLILWRRQKEAGEMPAALTAKGTCMI